MLVQGNVRICLPGYHGGISTAATFRHVKRFIFTFLQPRKSDRPILHTSSDPPALQHRRAPRIRRVRQKGRIFPFTKTLFATVIKPLHREPALNLKAQGHGAKGDNIYEFQIEFLEPVEPKPVCRVTQRQLNITVQKKESIDESDAEMELKEKEEEKINKMKIESRVPKDPFKHLKKGYLIMYNLVQFLGFSWIFVNMTVRLFILGKDSFYDTFHTISDMMYFCQTLALMEIMNSLIGLVRSPLIPAVMQVFGRNFVLFVILGSLEEMQSKPAVFFVFYFWSIIELFRYPYYMLSCIGIEWKPLTWLRYTAWIPLYPLGGLAEAVCIVQSIPIFSETGKFSLGLPNPLNVTIQFSFLLQIYLIALFLGVSVNFRHLYKQRKQHLGPKKRKMK
ncbi:very-long-chain (3R)-3-hydroxyacyl-CoA dehydratase 3 [Egretta garzetta]|uniref:very-long-chain (3R)-3-hydroxyacyl-CoA dehydratase 3 n=1 Tax=Egretta garzetta TaxID=188379 RepID=UPI00163BD641|nr:very-long-chain (3R)-3-hydroxyacyl-CoA dehydratase 3 [Egretta garzetta]